jgi:hypothetical protein
LPIIDRPALHFPLGNRLAVVVNVNLEHFPENRHGLAAWRLEDVEGRFDARCRKGAESAGRNRR